MDFERDLYFKEFDHEGPEEVSRRLSQGGYGVKKAAIAQEWLDRLAAAKRLASRAEYFAIIRSAKNAARKSAKVARSAITIATIAVAIAMLSVIISVLGLFIHGHN